jgi:hypothetical protein
MNANPRETLMRIDHLMAALGAAFTLILLGASLTYVPNEPVKSPDTRLHIGLRVSFHGISVGI